MVINNNKKKGEQEKIKESVECRTNNTYVFKKVVYLYIDIYSSRSLFFFLIRNRYKVF